MSHSAQARLDSAYNHRYVPVRLSDQIAVDNGGVIRPFSGCAARRVSILAAPFFGNAVMVDHGIHISGRNKESKPWLPKRCNALFVFPVRLRKNSHRITVGFQYPADNGVSKGRMIHISIPCHVHKIQLFDSSGIHIFF